MLGEGLMDSDAARAYSRIPPPSSVLAAPPLLHVRLYPGHTTSSHSLVRTGADLHDLHDLRSRSLMFVHNLVETLRASGVCFLIRTWSFLLTDLALRSLLLTGSSLPATPCVSSALSLPASTRPKFEPLLSLLCRMQNWISSTSCAVHLKT